MAAIRPPSARTLRAYRSSVYRAGAMLAQIGSLPIWQGRPSATILVMVGASNPGGRRRPDGWNARMTSRLRLAMRDVPICEGQGSLGCWSETMLMAPMDPRQAATIARRFGQNAILVIPVKQRCRLFLLKT